MTHNLTGVIPTRERSTTQLLAVPQGAGTGSLGFLSATHTLLHTDSGTRRTFWVTGLGTSVLFAGQHLATLLLT